ncbi:hypothetical protein OX284_012315 [Flavobacterium sp. SUN046]|jgi:hypothetical protein|uniref:hypothetical protein n=1 Tax=Flavobacterium sp. SUN046 TaxID=3002440 RepID=UPI002DB5F39A|nr:hypothetical protein [Flavobacterium sp. SUN046]MEC4050218.1 hypothetical protein [Flavobacterium sp. SUN046]
MSWYTVNIKFKDRLGTYSIHQIKPQDRRYIINLIAEEFPHFSRVKIASTIDICQKNNRMPMTINDFINSVQWHFK